MNHNLMDSLPEPKRKPIYVVAWDDLDGDQIEGFRSVDFSKAEHTAMFAGSPFGEVYIKKLYVPVGDWERLRDEELESL